MALGDLLRRKSQEGVRVLLLVWDDPTSRSVLGIKMVRRTHGSPGGSKRLTRISFHFQKYSNCISFFKFDLSPRLHLGSQKEKEKLYGYM